MTLVFESFLFGAANSVHCACMCGPLSVAFGGSARSVAGYQSGRAFSYALVGAALGGTGVALGSERLGTPTAIVAGVLAAALVVLALVGERGALRIPGLSRIAGKAMALGRGLPPARRAVVLGLCTPLLPCGLLWSACTGAALAGSALSGAGVMFGFALGSLPLLLLAQNRAPALARRFSPRTLAWVQRTAMLGAAGVLAWRAWAAQQGGCCH
ncbi:MAG: sulfite exporter TauE/SafE family protein [Planctomycetota bacterium]